MKEALTGLHHVTALSGPAQQNVDFYTRLLGLRLIKRTVNFDDPGTYHLYYGDEAGRPGTILTFFPWEHAAPGRAGAGMTSATSFAVPADALDFWMGRFADEDVDCDAPVERFGEVVLPFRDPDGLPLEIVAAADAPPAGHVSGRSGIPSAHALRSFHGVTLGVASPDRTLQLLIDVFGYAVLGEEDGRTRLVAPGKAPGRRVDVCVDDSLGRPGRGTVHHVAFRAADDAEQAAWHEKLADLGFRVTPVQDRQYFRSIYFREPGGVLFEIATDAPGFTADEPLDALGRDLKLPPWLEPRRSQIEQRLPELRIGD